MNRLINKAILFSFLLSIALNNVKAQTIESYPFRPFMSYEKASERAEKLILKMTIEEKIEMIRGKGFYVAENKRLGIPKISFTDAGQGIRLPKPSGNAVSEVSVAYPPTIALAATWNTELAYKYAYAIGEEAKSKGIYSVLGPGINIYRMSQNGRNFEYMGEDPYLVSRMAENYVTGMQNTGTMAVIKHFVANNTELDRRKSNSVIDERTLHEIYMPGFKAAIDAGVLGVMTSYNLVNGEWAGQSEYVIKKLLRQDLGYKGMVMTDWTSVWDGEKVIKSGQNLEMPRGKSLEGTKLLLDSGKVSVQQVDDMVKYIMISSLMMGYYDNGPLKKQNLLAYPENEKVALQTAREGIVLLKNRNNILPLKANAKILVTGSGLDENMAGLGSGQVIGYNVLNLKNAIGKEFKSANFVDKPSDDEIKNAPLVILSVGKINKESADQNFELGKASEEQIQKVCSLNPNTIVIVYSGSGIRMTGWNQKASAIIYAWYPGQIGQQAVAEILSGKVNPSGKLPFTLEKDFKDSPAYGYIPKSKESRKNSPKDGDRSLVYDVNYKEGIFVGYRWYESKKIEPLYPFGYGLSYSSFTYSNLDADINSFSKNGIVKVSIQVKNTGIRDGAETVQLYITDKISSVERPIKELKGFKKVNLKAGETKQVELILHKRDFEFWSPAQKDWFFEPGGFRINIGSSSADIKLSKDIIL